jgi:palmitoyltransferase
MRCTLPGTSGAYPPLFYPRHVVLPTNIASLSLGLGSLRAKRRTRRKWDAEYGRIGREGNMWWLGSMRANWEQTFGPKTWTWLRTSSLPLISNVVNVTDETPAVPVGTAADKGLDFPRNPRFNADGVWLPRKQWPADLR